MVSGFLPGFLLASTNGMFIGSLFGMFIGISLGILNGKCCGVMGIIEGIMAGFMGGLMGAMTAFMLFNDNLIPSMIIVFIISAIILFSLNYMIYKEMKTEERKIKEDQFSTFAITFVLINLTIWLMIYGPRSGVFG
jgi:ABC-type dipeptide/oligopeptide/nickel transport system permease subunit